MVSKKDLKDLEFNCIDDYYQYIIDSDVNGQRSQAKNLFKKLTVKQKLSFINWLHYDSFVNDSLKQEITNLLTIEN